MNSFDFVVVGGGMVGAAVAVGLAQQGKTVAIIESQAPDSYEPSQAMDIRVSAISHTSVELLHQLNAWQSIEAMRVCPYKRLETWEHPECRTRFNADSLGIEQLGYIVENRVIQLGLWQQLTQFDNITLFCPEQLDSLIFDASTNTNKVILKSGIELVTHWVVGADGANSSVRQQAGIGITAWDYRQDCMLINVETEKSQQDITWQQFTPCGPRSFLPLCGHQASLVWYDAPSKIRRLVNMSEKDLQKEILHHFPEELGGIRVLQSGSFPLTRRHAQKYIQDRCVLVGDAAHTINPLAGQGVNLGFKDVQALLDVCCDKEQVSESDMRTYERHRRGDNLVMQTGMDVFYKTFSNDSTPLKFARNAILKMADGAGPIKTKVLKYALGL